MPIKKRRPIKHLSKNEEGLRRRHAQEQSRLNTGRLETRFPSVKRLHIQLEFYSKEQQLLSSEQRTFEGHDTLSFFADCAGRCGNGRTDMEGVVNQMINARQSSRASRIICPQTLYAGSSETCGCEFRCKLTAEYFPAAL